MFKNSILCPSCGSDQTSAQPGGRQGCMKCFDDFSVEDVAAVRVGAPKAMAAAACSRILMPNRG